MHVPAPHFTSSGQGNASKAKCLIFLRFMSFILLVKKAVRGMHRMQKMIKKIMLCWFWINLWL